jgi:pullulanase
MNTKIFFYTILLSIIMVIMSKDFFTPAKSKPGLTKKQIEFLKRNDELNKIYSDKKLGSFVENDKTFFRLFAPNAEKVFLVTKNSPEDSDQKEYEMQRDENGAWETFLAGEHFGLLYGYKVKHSDDPESGKVICVDPYAKAVASYNTYFNPRLSIIIKENNYNLPTGQTGWEDDNWIQRDWRDLIIYEMHIRDMTEHESSGVNERGTYEGLTEKGKRGGLDYIKSLGVNTVELLPAQEFGNVEAPFKDSSNGKFNTWNPYERNHWGYMTGNYFAPESYYAENTRKLEHDNWSGTDAKAVNDFKDMVKSFHREGIGVIMDVVYNHLSEYEIGNLKQIDKEYYFRLDENGNFIQQSYCGNDLKTERPMVRKLIVESILYWMKEYHVDGFRFDLGKLIDWETIEKIIYEAKKINPYVVFVCEPWGGGYDPAGFSIRGWGAWNDQIRNGIKGENPFNGLGWIFGNFQGNNNPDRIKSYVNGTLLEDTLGLFKDPQTSVNYLESHDGYTLGDFIRLGLGDNKKDEVITDVDKMVKLTPLQMKLNKLAALFLFTSRGITMIHSGQEFARTKVIPQNVTANERRRGMIDDNSYDKDNETNYINYNHAGINSELLNYYKGLISLRTNIEAFRKAGYDDVQFFQITDNPFAIGYRLKYQNDEFLVLMNADRKKTEEFILPDGNWAVLVNGKSAGNDEINDVNLKLNVEPTTGYVLIKKSK